jgi:adenosylcobyric acid synthase
MFVGTGSNVGKSILNAGFCRIFLQDGYAPAPFKAQNMSLNSYATPDGFEIGRAQAVQAEACRIPCSADMNPVLLKPNDVHSSQVILNGKPIGNQSAYDYFMKTDRDRLFNEALKAFNRLSVQYHPVVMEGAGSISELNLKDRDITNMRIALATGAAVFLVADIDRGGVFGSVYGTIELLTPEERSLMSGIIINKFRGDMNLFTEGKEILEKLTGIPVIGIIPWFDNIHLEEEDSVALDTKKSHTDDTKINVAVVMLQHLSNFTDFSDLERQPGIQLYYATQPEDLQKANYIILPGSKNTISDLLFLRKSGMARAIQEAHQRGIGVYGICGGYQMMGNKIYDPQHVEGDNEFIQGLGLLPVETTLTGKKTTEQQIFRFGDEKTVCHGYEIHMGETIPDQPSPLCYLSDGRPDGYWINERTWGTYLHGIFDNASIINRVFRHNTSFPEETVPDYLTFKENQYDMLAALIRENVDMQQFYQSIQLNEQQ